MPLSCGYVLVCIGQCGLVVSLSLTVIIFEVSGWKVAPMGLPSLTVPPQLSWSAIPDLAGR